MRILAVDIGAGTQDILVFDSSVEMGNQVKMVLPSPTVIAARRIARATQERHSVLLTGVIMGGGPNTSALKRHMAAGLRAYATPQAALTFNDDLAQVEGLGVTIISPEEIHRLRDAEEIQLRDLDLEVLGRALAGFDVDPYLDAIAVAVLDHGHSPPGVSNRLFRFDHLRRLAAEKEELPAWAYLAPGLPAYLTRMNSVAASVDLEVPVLLLDTAAAAALGALQDPEVGRHPDRVIVNVGNAHTVAFHLHQSSIRGLFEHHTGLLDAGRIDSLVAGLVAGTLSSEEIYREGGHGCVTLGQDRCTPLVAVTGPRRRVMAGSTLEPRFAVPHGDMMLVGCFGLIRACAERMEHWREEIEQALTAPV